MRTILFVFLWLTFGAGLKGQQKVPSFEEVISLRSVRGMTISNDGRQVAFTLETVDWEENRFDAEIWLAKDGEEPFQLTNTPEKSSMSPVFSPNGKWLAFLADRGNKNQIHVMRVDGGEARAFTTEEEGISSFRWHPSGEKFIFLREEAEDTTKKERTKRYGKFEADDREYTLSHLWQIDFKPGMLAPSERPCYEKADSLKEEAGCIVLPEAERLTEGAFTVTSFIPSPDGSKVAFSHQPDPLINSSVKSDISVLDLGDKKMTLLVDHPGPDWLQDWSPDSKEILYTSRDDTTSYYYTNSRLFAMTLESKARRQLAKDVDENLGGFIWRKTGIYGTVWNKTKLPLYRIDPGSGEHIVLLDSPAVIFGLAFSKSGNHMAFTGRNGDQLAEVFTTATAAPKPVKLTDMTGQVSDWKVAQSEVISWESKDGTTIEGILHKPKDYDPSKKYPLMVIVHGGPTGIDLPSPVPGYVYPVLQWLDKGCVVLRPNYRGSAGYGEAFRSLNVKNLGVGDAWDVLSGIEHLNAQGVIDTGKMGCMGWSQGGYISAFLTTHSDVFKAISVGAGISNWMTYYVNTDIHPFTRQYLKATPWEDEEIYRKTSPMTSITNAKTPTLIQHGEFDKRVPIANAYELVQGLRDQGVPCELIVYKGFGHGINKPKEILAATWHNWQWFSRYIWGEEVELPVEE